MVLVAYGYLVYEPVELSEYCFFFYAWLHGEVLRRVEFDVVVHF